MLIVFMFLAMEAQRLADGDANARTQELNEAVAQVRGINSLAESVISFNSGVVYPQTIINLLGTTRTDGVVLNSYRVNYANGEILIFGNAQTRSNLLAFKQSLEASEDLANINLPIANVLQETDINFEVRLLYKSLVPTSAVRNRINVQ
jgi:hypothetical protein